LEYFNFFTAPDGPSLMNNNLERMYEVNHGFYPSPIPEEKGRDIWMREMFCTPGAMREYVAREGKWKDASVELKPYARNSELKKRFIDRLGKSGFEAPVQYYHLLVKNTMLDDERDLCKAEGGEVGKIEVPLLYIGQTGDFVCRVVRDTSVPAVIRSPFSNPTNFPLGSDGSCEGAGTGS
jgi:soluble epoxide hydrolase/lipid-phosphate phosphatase